MASAGGTHGAQNPAPGGIGWRPVARAGTITFRVVAGERPISPGNEKRPQQDSNLRSRLRRPLLSPLSYGGYAPSKGYQPKSPPGHAVAQGAITRQKTLPSRE